MRLQPHYMRGCAMKKINIKSCYIILALAFVFLCGTINCCRGFFLSTGFLKQLSVSDDTYVGSCDIGNNVYRSLIDSEPRSTYNKRFREAFHNYIRTYVGEEYSYIVPCGSQRYVREYDYSVYVSEGIDYEIIEGRMYEGDSDEVVIYGGKLKVGDTIDIDSTSYKVVGKLRYPITSSFLDLENWYDIADCMNYNQSVLVNPRSSKAEWSAESGYYLLLFDYKDFNFEKRADLHEDFEDFSNPQTVMNVKSLEIVRNYDNMLNRIIVIGLTVIAVIIYMCSLYYNIKELRNDGKPLALLRNICISMLIAFLCVNYWLFEWNSSIYRCVLIGTVVICVLFYMLYGRKKPEVEDESEGEDEEDVQNQVFS